MTRALTDRDYNVRIAVKAIEVKQSADRARAQGKGPHRELGHVQRALLARMAYGKDFTATELAAAMSVPRTHLLVYTIAALQVRGEIEKTDTGKWRRVKRARAAA